jgi:Protein of unknown function (DUF1573)/HYDIN/CFA65/VesB-like, Ig-like domain
MRRVLLAFVIVFFAAGGALAQNVPGIVGGNAAPPGPQPKAQLLNPLFNFGTALEGQMVNHTFKLKNVGKGELLIRGVKTSCGCTAAAPSKSDLAPGETTDITVGFDTHFQKGHQTRTITAFTNDPAMPQAVMTMQGIVRQQVAATPDQVDFGNLKKGSVATQEVKIQDLTKKKGFSVGPITHSNQNITVVQEKGKDGKPGDVLKITLEKTMPLGTFDDTVNVVTNRVPIQVDVFGKITGDLSIEPAQVSFGIVPKGQSSERIVKLTNTGSRDIKLLQISSSAPSVSAASEPIKPGKEYKIIVKLRRGAPEGQLSGQLAIKTDDPEQQTLTVPFYAIVGQFKI